MRVLGLDLGKHTGVCVLEDGKVEELRVYELTGSEGERFADLSALLELYADVDAVVFEEPMFHRGGPATKQAAGYRAIVMMECERAWVPYVSVPVLTLKKFATGSGKAQKSAMIQAAAQATGLGPLSEHDADAYWAARYGAEWPEW